MPKLLILADDFTGALDTGIQFSKKGIQTMVHVASALGSPDDYKGYEVLVLDTESRHMQPEEAYEIIYKIIKQAPVFEFTYIYKKTDSALRGNVGSELSAVMDAAGIESFMFIPAYPKTNRTTVNGIQYVGGIPVSESGFSKDILDPVVKSSVSEIIHQTGNAKTRSVSMKSLMHFIPSKGIHIFDASTDENLIAIGKVLEENDLLYHTAGCAGFADILSTFINFKKQNNRRNINCQRILIVCGSLHEKSAEQINYSYEKGYPGVTLTEKQLYEEEYWKSSSGKREMDDIATVCGNHKIFTIQTMQLKTQSTAVSHKPVDRETAKTASRNLSSLTKHILDRIRIDALVLFGGDTLIGIMNELEARAIFPVEEIEPGVVFSRFVGGQHSPYIVSKAGGFGSVDVIDKIKEFLIGGS